MRGTRRIALLGATLAALLPPAAVALATKPWNRSQVLALTQALLAEVKLIKRNLARDWDRADHQSPRYVVLEDVMALHRRAVALDGLVRAGEGAEKTAPVFRRVLTAVQHARRDAAEFPAIERQRVHIDKADAALARLKDYYGPELTRLAPEASGDPSPSPVKRTPPPRVPEAPPDKTFRRRTTEPAPVAGCPRSVMHDKNLNHPTDVRIWVRPEVTGRNEVTTTVGVVMTERAGHYARGELVERRPAHVPDLPPECRIRRVVMEPLATCEFVDDDEEEDAHKCDIVRGGGLVRTLRVTAMSPGLDFDCDDEPGKDAYAEVHLNPIEVEVVCE